MKSISKSCLLYDVKRPNYHYLVVWSINNSLFLFSGVIKWCSQCFWCRCGARQAGDLGSSNEDEALDGILGFGKSNLSIISQLASSGKVRKMFAHCLDGVNGGGIFAIGHVVQPKVNMTPLVPNQYVRSFMGVMVVSCSPLSYL